MFGISDRNDRSWNLGICVFEAECCAAGDLGSGFIAGVGHMRMSSDFRKGFYGAYHRHAID